MACTLSGVIACLLPAAAGGATVTANRSVPMPEAQGVAKSVTAKCPKGSNVISGGWRSTAGVVEAIDSHRVRERSWKVRAVRYTNDTTASTLTAFAYCDTKARRLREAATTLTVPDAEGLVVEHEVACPAGKEVVSGGFDLLGANPYAGVIVGSFREDAPHWQIDFQAAQEDAAIRVSAYCARRGPDRTRSAGGTAGPDHFVTLRSPRCPGTRSAGFQVSGVGMNDNPVIVDRLMKRGKRWVAHGIDSDEAGFPLNLFALC
jgi:hypothetical protein